MIIAGIEEAGNNYVIDAKVDIKSDDAMELFDQLAALFRGAIIQATKECMIVPDNVDKDNYKAYMAKHIETGVIAMLEGSNYTAEDFMEI